MPVIFDNPAGGFALLGVPALIGIHLLQARSRRTRASTLFLLERLTPESRGGLRRDKLRRSLPLVLRILAVLASTWVLCEPRFVKPDATLRVAVVLDSSVSMEACRPRVLERLPGRLAALSRGAVRTQYLVTESDSRRPTIYAGEDISALKSALAAWRPGVGMHDPQSAILQACTAVRAGGVAVFVTDTPTVRPSGAAVLAYGAAIENTGFSGLSVAADGRTWSALVRHYGRAPRRLTWRAEVAGRSGEPGVLELAPGGTGVIAGDFPAGSDRFRLRLERDDFGADDMLPVIKPEAKRIRVLNALGGPDREVVAKILASIPQVSAVTDAASADLVYATPGDVVADRIPAVLFPATEPVAPRAKGAVLAESHPWVSEVAWQGLLIPACAGECAGPDDLPLVWAADSPLIALRSRAGKPAALVFDFKIAQSNAAKVPAVVVLLRRHLESVRERLATPYALNMDTHQPLVVGGSPDGLMLRVDDAPARNLTRGEVAVLRSPDAPAFFEVTGPAGVRVRGAAAFADVREADFSACGEADTLADRERALTREISVPDPWRPVWLALVAALLFAAWWTQRESSSR